MDETAPQNRCQTVSIPLGQFSARLNETAQLSNQAGHSSMHSRLALIHQTARHFALEAVRQAGFPTPTVDIDELTNPPLLDLPIDPDDDQQVVIRFSYQPTDTLQTEIGFHS